LRFLFWLAILKAGVFGFSKDVLGAGCFNLNDTIPFTLTSYNNISVQATLNNTDTVDLMFHTASGAVFLTKEASKGMASIDWDETGAVNSWGGRSDVRHSSSNLLEISGMHWDSIEITEDTHSGHFTDGKFGLHLFDNKIVEVDFDESIIIVHEQLPTTIDTYDKLAIEYKLGSIFLTGDIEVNGDLITHSFMLHSGYSGMMMLDDAFVKSNGIDESLEVIGEKILKDSGGNELITKKALLPRFLFGGTALSEVPIAFFEGALANQSFSLIGGDLIRRYHWYIDLQEDVVYIHANDDYNQAYADF